MRTLLVIIATIAAITLGAHAGAATDARTTESAQQGSGDMPSTAPAAKPAAPLIKPASPARQHPTGDRSAQPDCAWTGKRTVQVLVRDDLIAADGFFKFYSAFGCPVPHLGAAFGCTVDEPDLADAKALDARIEACWDDPAAPATAPQPAAAAMAEDSKPVPKVAAPESKPGSGTAYPKR
jgi:hypothetical protein